MQLLWPHQGTAALGFGDAHLHLKPICKRFPSPLFLARLPRPLRTRRPLRAFKDEPLVPLLAKGWVGEPEKPGPC